MQEGSQQQQQMQAATARKFDTPLSRVITLCGLDLLYQVGLFNTPRLRRGIPSLKRKWIAFKKASNVLCSMSLAYKV